MGIVFQSGIGEASPFARLGFFKGMICDEPYCIFRHLNLDTFQRRYPYKGIIVGHAIYSLRSFRLKILI